MGLILNRRWKIMSQRTTEKTHSVQSPHTPDASHSTRLTGWSSDYYKLPEGATELQDIIEAKNMNFSVGNIFKAAYRLGTKEGTTDLYDLEKILWFAKRELDFRERNLKK